MTSEKKIVCDTGKNFFHKPRLLLPEEATIKRKENLNYKVDNIAFLYLYLQLGHPKHWGSEFSRVNLEFGKKEESNFFWSVDRHLTPTLDVRKVLPYILQSGLQPRHQSMDPKIGTHSYLRLKLVRFAIENGDPNIFGQPYH